MAVVGAPLSKVKSQPDVVLFDTTDKAHPKLKTTVYMPTTLSVDSFYPMPDNGYLFSVVGDNQGGTPGRIAKIKGDGTLEGKRDKQLTKKNGRGKGSLS